MLSSIVLHYLIHSKFLLWIASGCLCESVLLAVVWSWLWAPSSVVEQICCKK